MLINCFSQKDKQKPLSLVFASFCDVNPFNHGQFQATNDLTNNSIEELLQAGENQFSHTT